MRARRLLVVSYDHPPFPGPGGNRWLAMARYLRDAGHSVTILASDAYGGLPDDDELGVVRVATSSHRARCDDFSDAGSWRPRPHFGPEAGIEVPPPALLTKVLVPDAYVASWLPAAVVAAQTPGGRRRGRLPRHERSAGVDAPGRAAPRPAAGPLGSPTSATAGTSSRYASRSRPRHSARSMVRSSVRSCVGRRSSSR